MLEWEMAFSSLVNPSSDFAASAEIDFDVFLFFATLATLIFVAAEYAAEHWGWEWGEKRLHLIAVAVLFGFGCELVFESGSFGYSYILQSRQADTIKELGVLSAKARSDASAAITDAHSASDEAKKASRQISDLRDVLRDLNKQEKGVSNSLKRDDARLSDAQGAIGRHERRLKANEDTLAKDEKRVASDESDISAFEEARRRETQSC